MQREQPEFQGKVALVTAAAGAGIGQAIARRLAAGGANVVVTDIHARRTREVTAAIQADYPDVQLVGHAMDAADRANMDRVLAEVASSLGPIQILINNAAINVVGDIFDYDPNDWDWCLAVNLSGPWYLCHKLMPVMRDAGGGAIVNISTYAPDVGGGGVEAPYAVTKGGLNALTRSCAVEGGPHGIRSNAVSMGVVTGTKFIDDNPQVAERLLPQTPLGRHASVEDIAEATAFLASERARHITGEILNVAGGIYMRN